MERVSGEGGKPGYHLWMRGRTRVAGSRRGAVLVVVGRGGETASRRLLRLVHRAAQHGPGGSEGRGGGTHERTEKGEIKGL